MATSCQTSGGSKGGGTPSVDQNVLNFMQFFRKSSKFVCWHPRNCPCRRTVAKMRFGFELILQWRIQDFPKGVPISKLGQKHYLFQIFPEYYMKMKNWTETSGGGARPCAPWVRQCFFLKIKHIASYSHQLRFR